MFPTTLTLSEAEMVRLFSDVSRLKALHDIKETRGDQGLYDRFTQVVHDALSAPGSTISLAADDHLYFESQIGVEPKLETLLMEDSVCQLVIAANQPLIVPDATTHPMLKNRRIVTELGLQAYLGMPITLRDGAQLGTLCAFDIAPRAWDETDISITRELSEILTAEFDLRADVYVDNSRQTQLDDLRQRIDALLGGLDTSMAKADFLAALRAAREHYRL